MGCICLQKTETDMNLQLSEVDTESSDKLKKKTSTGSMKTIDFSFVKTKKKNSKKEITRIGEIDINEIINNLYTEYNYIRQDPTPYIPLLSEFSKRIKRNIRSKSKDSYYIINDTCKVVINADLPKIFENTINFLKQARPLHILERDEILMVSAKKGLDKIDLEKDQRVEDLKKILDNYDLSIGSDVNRIIGHGDYNPNIIIMLQLLDSRDNFNSRKAIFSESYKSLGISASFHSSLKLICVVDFAN